MTSADLPVIEAWFHRTRRDSLVMDAAVAVALIGVTGAAIVLAIWVIAAGFSGGPMGRLMLLFFLTMIGVAIALIVLAARWLPSHVEGMRALRDFDIPAAARMLVALYEAPAPLPVADAARLVPGVNLAHVVSALVGLAGVLEVSVPHPALALPVEARAPLEAEIRRP